MRIVLVFLILGIVLGAYLSYVRGGGVQPELGAPQVIERQGGARTYAWTQKAEMPTARTEVTAAVRDGKVYVIGGFDGFARTVATVEVYDPATDDWQVPPICLRLGIMRWRSRWEIRFMSSAGLQVRSSSRKLRCSP